MLIDLTLFVMLLTNIFIFLFNGRSDSTRMYLVVPGLILSTILMRSAFGLLAVVGLLGGGADHVGNVLLHLTGALSGESLPVLGLVLTAIGITNLFVLSKGISRATEVMARFYLDSVPGRQIAIDADLQNGMITYDDARARRAAIDTLTTSYSLFDSISKFILGENISSLIIIVVALVILLAVNGAEPQALATLLTIALVWQGLQAVGSCSAVYPLFVFSAQNRLTVKPVVKLRDRMVLIGALTLSGLLFAWVPLLGLVSLGLPGWLLLKRPPPAPPAPPAAASAEEPLRYDPVQASLVIEVDPLLATYLAARIGEFRELARQLRQAKQAELGFNFPAIAVVDNAEMEAGVYRITVNGLVLAEVRQYADRLLAIPSCAAPQPIPGIPGEDPVFGLQSVWIDSDDAPRATAQGWIVTNPLGIMLTHLDNLIATHPEKFLYLAESKRIVAEMENTLPYLLAELTAKDMSTVGLHGLFCALLEDGFSLTPLTEVLLAIREALYLAQRAPRDIVAFVRRALVGFNVNRYRDESGTVQAAVLRTQTAQSLEEVIKSPTMVFDLSQQPSDLSTVLANLKSLARPEHLRGGRLVLLMPGSLMPLLVPLMRREAISVFALAHEEISTSMKLQVFATV